MWRQGDVLIERVDDFKQTSLNETKNRLLVKGEGRYHGHFIVGEAQVYTNEDFGPENLTSHFLNIKQEAVLKHLHIITKQATGEHADLRLPPGKYRVTRQREYNPYAKIIEIIRD